MKPIYLFLGFLCVALGLIGIPTPGLPTTPFLLLAMFFFGKGSPRVQQWFMTTKIYQKYLKNYSEKKGMTMRQKLTILLISAPFSIFAFFVLPNIWGKLVLALVIAFQYYYFFFKIKTLENPPSNVK